MIFIGSGQLARSQGTQASSAQASGTEEDAIPPEGAVTAPEVGAEGAVDAEINADAAGEAPASPPVLVVREETLDAEEAVETIVVEITPVSTTEVLLEQRPLVGRVQRLFRLYGWPLGLTVLLLLATLLTLAAREWGLHFEGFDSAGQVQDQELIDNLAAAQQQKLDLETEIETNQARHEAWMEEYPAQERQKMRQQRLERLEQQDADLIQLLASGRCPNCDLEGADLANKDLAGADLRGANLNGANLAGSNLQGANLAYASLLGANLYQSQLQGASLYGANLIDANLSQAQGQGATFAEGLLEYADFSLGVFTQANFNYSSLAGAAMQGTNLNGSSFLGADVVNIGTDASTQARGNVLPNGEKGGLFVSPRVRRAGEKAETIWGGVQEVGRDLIDWGKKQAGRLGNWLGGR